MPSHEQVVKKLMRRPGVRAEVKRIEKDEAALLDAMLKAREAAGLTQADVARRMGTQAPAVARLESALSTGKHSPSIDTLKRYAHAVGCELQIRFIPGDAPKTASRRRTESSRAT